jgi:hypothetical protein
MASRGVPRGAIKGLGPLSQLSKEEKRVLKNSGAMPPVRDSKTQKPVHVKFGGGAAIRPVSQPGPKRYISG